MPHDSDSDAAVLQGSSPLHATAHNVGKGSSSKLESVEPVTVRSTDSDVQSDDLSPPARHKMVAIDTSQNKHFTRRLLPVQSPEFDNVIDQVYIMM